MTQLPVDALLRYEEIKIQTKALEAEAKELLETITPHLQADVVMEGARGVFTVRSLPRYVYPAAIAQAKADLKVAEEAARANGDATVSHVLSLVYNQHKE